MISLLAALAASTAAHPDHVVNLNALQAPDAQRTDIGDGLYMIAGRGGNILFSTGEDGTFVVDSQYANTAEKNLELIREVAEEPVVFVLNTHFHGDHVGGNLAFYDAGATVVAHDNVRGRLEAQSGDNAVDENALPVITFSESATFHWNDQEIRVMHTPSAHTDGDAVIYLPDANVIHTGDTMFSGLYPFIDLGSGGSVDGVIAALTAIHDMADDDTMIVPGHGPLSSKEDVKTTIDMLKETRTLVREQMMEGLSRDEIIAAKPLAEYSETYSWGFIDGDRFTGTLYDDLLASDDEAEAAADAGE